MVGGTVRDGEAPAEGEEATEAKDGELGHSSTLRARQDADFEQLLREAAHVADAPADLLPAPGQVIAAKYRVEALLGRGGMGAVYRASHVVSGKQVAIKWMLGAHSSEQGRQRFLREAKIAARVDHPNVVDVYDIGQDADMGLYLVMQLLRGETLRTLIARGTGELGETLDLLLPAMRGVAAMHEAGVVHRDLKPDNIFLCDARAGSARIAKVLDFGISAMMGPERSDPTLTGEGAAIGTPAYMSPEQLSDSRKVDARSDVYAFGVILFETLTGALPFQAESHNGLVVAIATAAPPDPRAARPELPEQLASAILRALAKRREDRFDDMTAFIDALEPFATQRSSTAGRDPARASTPARSIRVGSARSALWLLIVLSLGGGVYWWWRQGDLAGHESERPAPLATPVREKAALVPVVEPRIPASAQAPAADVAAPAAHDGAENERQTTVPGSRPPELRLTKRPGPLRTTKQPAASVSTAAPANATPEQAPSPAAEPAPPPGSGSKARSGKISVDDL